MPERPRGRLHVRHVLTQIACLAALATCLGCTESGPSFDSTEDDGALNILLVDVIESNSVWDKAAAPKPQDRAKYSKYTYSAVEKQIEPTSAKMKVEIKDPQGNVVATKDWTATKADGTWKLTSAPLP